MTFFIVVIASDEVIGIVLNESEIVDSAGEVNNVEHYINKVTPRPAREYFELFGQTIDEFSLTTEPMQQSDAIDLQASINFKRKPDSIDEAMLSTRIKLPKRDPFQCPIIGCDKVLALKRSLKRHVEQFHGKIQENGSYGLERIKCLQNNCKAPPCLTPNNFKQHHQQKHFGTEPTFEDVVYPVDEPKYKDGYDSIN